MKVLVCLCLLFAVVAVNGQYFRPLIPYFPYKVRHPSEEVYAASLGGAKVGLYGKEHRYDYRYPRFPIFPRYPYGGRHSEVTGVSLGGAKVGLYGKERY